MKNLHKVATIKRLAQSLGNCLKDVEFMGEKVIFHYEYPETDRTYGHADSGFLEEEKRLERLLTIKM